MPLLAWYATPCPQGNTFATWPWWLLVFTLPPIVCATVVEHMVLKFMSIPLLQKLKHFSKFFGLLKVSCGQFFALAACGTVFDQIVLASNAFFLAALLRTFKCEETMHILGYMVFPRFRPVGPPGLYVSTSICMC